MILHSISVRHPFVFAKTLARTTGGHHTQSQAAPSNAVPGDGTHLHFLDGREHSSSLLPAAPPPQYPS